MGKLFKAGPLEPIQEIGRTVALLGAQGFIGTKAGGPSGTAELAVWQVLGIEPIPPLAPRGFLPLYYNGPSPLPGYGGPYGGELINAALPTVTGSSGASAQIIPQALSLNPKTIFQMRWVPLVVGALPAGMVNDDLDFGLNLPAATAHYQLQQIGGYINPFFLQDFPASEQQMAAQGTQASRPAASPVVRSWLDDAWLSEVYIWERNPPQFNIWNRGSLAIPQDATTTTVMIGLAAAGFRLNIDIYAGNADEDVIQTYGAQTFSAPKDIVILPTAALAPQSG